MDKQHKLEIRLLAKNGQPEEKLQAVEYSKYNLDYESKNRIKEDSGYVNFIKIDAKAFSKGKDGDDKSKQEANILENLSDIDIVGMESARNKANVAVCLIVWGLKLKGIQPKQVYYEDFEKLLEVVAKGDPLGFKKDDKKIKELKEKQEAGKKA